MLVPSNTSSLILSVHLTDDNGDPVTGQAYNTVGLAVSYRVESAGTYTAITLVDGTLGTYVASSWKEIGLGEYQLCLPNAAIVDGQETKLKIVVGSNVPLFDSVQARLPVSTGSGDRQITFTVSSGALAVAGARLTVLDGAIVVAAGTTDAGGELSVFLLDGTYTVRVATSPVYDTLAAQSLAVSADASVAYALTAVVIPASTDPAMCVVRFVVDKCGSPVVGASVTASPVGDNLSADKVLLERCVLTGTTDASGVADLELIQSSEFTRGGKYQIRVVSPDGSAIHARRVSVPSTSTAFAEELPDA